MLAVYVYLIRLEMFIIADPFCTKSESTMSTVDDGEAATSKSCDTQSSKLSDHAMPTMVLGTPE